MSQLYCIIYIYLYLCTYTHIHKCMHTQIFIFFIYFYGYLPDLQPIHGNASQLVHLIVPAYNSRQIFFPSCCSMRGKQELQLKQKICWIFSPLCVSVSPHHTHKNTCPLVSFNKEIKKIALRNFKKTDITVS